MNAKVESVNHPTPLSAQSSDLTLKAFQRQIPIVILAAVVAFALKLAMAYLTYGTNDVTTWQLDLAKVQAQGGAALYRDGVSYSYPSGFVQVFSHPPSMIHVLQFWGMLAALTHLPLQFWMRFTCALADAGSLFVICRLGRERPDLRFQPPLLVLIAACPVSIFISGFHGNTDPIMMFFLLVSVYLIETGRPPAWAGVFMGLALCVKVVPVILIPAALLYLPGWKSRLRFAWLAGAVVFLSGLPYTATNFWLVLHGIAGYNSLPSVWMIISGSLGISPAADKMFFIASTVLFSIGMNRFRLRFPLFAQCGLLISLALFIAPGFAVQYLAWAVPWIAWLGLGAALSYYLAAGTFLFVAYSHWSGGFPWYRADSLPLSPLGIMMGLLCWFVTGVALMLYIRAWLNRRGSGKDLLVTPSSPVIDTE